MKLSPPPQKGAPAAAKGRAPVRIASTPGEVESLRPLWNELERGGNHPFPEGNIDLFLAEVEGDEEVLRPHVIVLEGSFGSVIAAAQLRRASFRPRIGYLRVNLFKRPRLCLFLGAGRILGDAGGERAGVLVDELIRGLATCGADWAFLSRLPKDSPLSREAARRPGALCRDRLPTGAVNFTMTIPEKMEEFYAARSRNHRKNLRKLCNRIEKDFPGRIELRCFRERAEAALFCRDAEAVAKGTYQRSLGVGFAGGSAQRSRLEEAARLGMLRSYILYIDGEPRSFLTGLAYGDTYFAESTGYDPAMERYKTGTFLFLRAVEDLIALPGVTRLDFGRGTGIWKERFADGTFEDVSLRIFAPTPAGAAMNATRTLAELLTRAGRKASSGAGFYGRLKRGWRRFSAGGGRRKRAGRPSEPAGVSPGGGAGGNET